MNYFILALRALSLVYLRSFIFGVIQTRVRSGVRFFRSDVIQVSRCFKSKLM